MSARELKHVGIFLALLWSALLVIVLMAPCGLVRAAPPAAASGASAPPAPAAASAGAGDWSGTENAPSSAQLPGEASAPPSSSSEPREARHHHRHHRDDADEEDADEDQTSRTIFELGQDAVLPAGESADSVVAIGGAARSAGNASDVMSIAGSTQVTGPTTGDAVALFGDLYVDSAVAGDVVAIFGDVELGPHAVVGGDVSAVLGALKRDPAAAVAGQVVHIGGSKVVFSWLRPWLRQCLILGRPLGLGEGLGWAWTLALTMLALYVLVSLVFPRAVVACVRTLEVDPGRTVLASFLMVLVVPLALGLLAITFVGLIGWPFLIAGLLCATLFGKAAALSWIGRQALGGRALGTLAHPAAATLLGGALVLLVYLVPILGFVVFNLLGLLGLGMVVTTLLARMREQRTPPGAASLSGGASGGRAEPSAATGAAAAAAPIGDGGSVGKVAGVATMSGLADAGDAGMGAAGAGAGVGAAGTGAAGAGAAGPGAAGATSAPGVGLGGGSQAMPGSGGGIGAGAGRLDPAVAASLPRAGFWVRMGALAIDVLLVSVVMHVLLRHEHGLDLLVLAIYGAVMWKLRGTTIGGIVFDLQVVRVDGRPLDAETAVIRALSCFLSLFVSGLGFLWIAFDAGHQAWHDKIAGTVVVRVPKAGATARLA